MYEEIAARRRAGDLEEREDILSMLMLARDEDGEGLSDARAARPADHAARRRSRDDGHRPGLDVRRAVPPPRVLERLRGELADGEDDYLSAVVDETLRVRPVVPEVGRKARRAVRR